MPFLIRCFPQYLVRNARRLQLSQNGSITDTVGFRVDYRSIVEKGKGLADIVIELNGLNPQIASRLCAPLTKWRSYVGRSELMRAELERLAAAPQLSPDVYEVVTKSLR